MIRYVVILTQFLFVKESVFPVIIETVKI